MFPRNKAFSRNARNKWNVPGDFKDLSQYRPRERVARCGQRDHATPMHRDGTDHTTIIEQTAAVVNGKWRDLRDM